MEGRREWKEGEVKGISDGVMVCRFIDDLHLNRVGKIRSGRVLDEGVRKSYKKTKHKRKMGKCHLSKQ